MVSKQMFIVVVSMFIFVDDRPGLTCQAVIHYLALIKFFLVVHCKNVSDRLTFIVWYCVLLLCFLLKQFRGLLDRNNLMLYSPL